MAVRRALGGGRARLARQTLLESLILAMAGAAAGLALSVATRSLLGDLLTGSLGAGAFGNLEMRVAFDPTLVGLSVAMGFAATLFFGLLPAMRLSDLDPIAWLKSRSAGAAAPRLTIGRVLIALQIAVSVPLVVGAALFLRTVSNLGGIELGFDPRGLVSFQVDPGYTQLSPDEYDRLYTSLLAAVQEIPGVTSATLIENALMSGITSNGSRDVDGERHMVYFNAIGPAFIETMGQELLAGRMPGLQDDRDAPRVGVVNQTAVREVYGGASPIGRTIGDGERAVQIVGVINDTPYRSQREPVPATLYESALQRDGYGGHHVVLRTDAPVARIEPLVRVAVHRVDADVPVPEMRTQTELMAQTSARERVFTRLLTLFGMFALLLASIGLHGVTSYSVSRRTSEIGVRVAVGARPDQILSLVLRQVVVLAGLGLLIGVPVALAAGPLVGSLLYGVAPTDPVAIIAASAVMLVVTIGAGLLPALRAARVDALVALRTE
jgi:predicted permease